jgi:hypothetical protein
MPRVFNGIGSFCLDNISKYGPPSFRRIVFASSTIVVVVVSVAVAVAIRDEMWRRKMVGREGDVRILSPRTNVAWGSVAIAPHYALDVI